LPKHERQSSHSSHGPAGLDRIVGEVKKLPRDVWPVVQSHWCQPKCFDGMALYLAALPASAAEVANATSEKDAVCNIPLTILSAGNASPVQRAEHQELARNSTEGRVKIVADSGHWMHFDRPDEVIGAIQEMVALCRSRQDKKFEGARQAPLPGPTRLPES
jgi:pimeloyl-ACP methyl ester carboxylesterase